ncbi:MAG: glycoside hydrolase family 32 protein [Bacteroidota bacterium]
MGYRYRIGLCALWIFITVSFYGCQSQVSEHKEAAVQPDSAIYQEQHRPQFHFSPAAHWMNDPNGMVYYDGEYHLFYQYYPDSTVWGPMHWGHAVTKDLVHWEHLPIALYPDSLGYIFSGSAVVDVNNTSGFGEHGKPPLVAMFTHHDIHGERSGSIDFQYQSIAYSNDKGRTWIKYKGNPVIPNPGIKDFRDPKVIWHAPSQKWVMVLAAYDKVMIYHSPDLKRWTYASEFGIAGDDRLWECPDLFPMKVAGTGETKWVLILSIQKKAPNGGTATGYFVGDFDGEVFEADPEKQQWADYGTDNYAMVTWSDVPESDGRRLAMGWMSNWQYAQVVPTEKWRSAMTLPRELTLHKEGAQYELRSKPVRELEALTLKDTLIEIELFKDVSTILADEPGRHLYKIDLSLSTPITGKVELKMSNSRGQQLLVGLDVDQQLYYIDRTNAGESSFHDGFAKVIHGELRPSKEWQMQVYLDHSSVELFDYGGRTAMTAVYFPDVPYDKIELLRTGGENLPVNVTLSHLNRIW